MTAKGPAVGAYDPGSTYARVLAAVLRLGECTVAQVYAEVAAFIPAPMAARRGRSSRAAEASRTGRQGWTPGGRPPRLSVTDAGRRRVVTDYLYKLKRHGHVRQVRRGVYAPPLPKLFAPDQRAS